MTERKPAGVSFETWVDRQIREATERGAFDDLPGAGEPLPGVDQPYDEQWWVKGRLHREGLSTEVLLPTPLRLRKEIQRLPDTVRELRSERAVREVVDELNERIVAWLRAPSGPHVPVGRVDAASVVARWHADREAAWQQRTPLGTAPADHGAAVDTTTRRLGGWWRRITRRRGTG